jgi:TIR domain
MTDVFFSYSNEDRERVQPIHDALAAEGFDVFWDREPPPDREWDEWVRQQMDAARCTIVFWSPRSMWSDEIVHEALVAKNWGKLISVILEPLDSGQFPAGHYTAQAIVIPEGEISPEILQSLCAEVETKVIRPRTRRKLAGLEEQVSALTSLREEWEKRRASLQGRVAKLEGQAELERAQKAELEAALAATQQELRMSNEVAASAVALEQTILRLSTELRDERQANTKLRTELAYLESRAPDAIKPANALDSKDTSLGVYISFRDVFLLAATMSLLVSAANGSGVAMAISSILVIAGVLWGILSR